MDRQNEAFHYQLQQLDNVLRELGAKGEVGEDPAWILDYVYRLDEIREALREIASSRREGNPSHKSYP